MRESAEARDIRHAKLRLLQEHYSSFARFLRDAMKVLGFTPTWQQYDIANYLQYGPQNLMVQAQRGEAKSTITALFAVWCLIHDPSHRILVVSAGSTQASEISTLITRLILTWEPLACMRPDKNNGDRTAVDAFDVHYSLKGIDKSPSVACVGISANMPGKRADLLIADDVESPKNARTAMNRELLLAQTLEFSAICTGKPGTPGRIVYLGTPQTSDSIYNSLPGRGYDLRIWPGRYPTPAEREHYGPFLAPALVNRMEADPALQFGGGPLGDMGQVTDEVLANEEKHQKELRDRGPSSYQLNYMLNTALMDSQRFPLKLEHLVVMPGGSEGNFPLTLVRGMMPSQLKTLHSSGMGFQMQTPHELSGATAPFQGIHMQIDPGGSGDNETAFAVTAFLNSTVYVLAVGGYQGGYSRDSLDGLAEIAEKFKPNTLSIEKNFGHGGFAQVFLPILRAKWQGSVLEPMVHGQKEARIIGILEPVMARGSLVFLESAVEMDNEHTEKYISTGKRRVYSLFHQISKITKQRGSLAYDDRIDALAASVSTWVKQLALDQDKVIEAQKQAEHAKWLKDPTGMLAARQSRPLKRSTSLLQRYNR